MEDHSYIGFNKSGNKVWLSADERRGHGAIVGATGTGKSVLLRCLAEQAITSNEGLLLLDVHGDLAEAVLHYVRPSRRNEICYLNIADLENPIALNLLEDTHPDRRAVVVDGVVSGMRSIWHDSWGPRMELILRHACRALIEGPEASIAMLPRFLTDDKYRQSLMRHVSDPFARAFFERRFEAFRDTHRAEIIDPVLNKVESFLAFPGVLNLFGQARSTLHLDHAMARGRIIIVNLSKSHIGETAAHLTGALLLSSVLSKLTLGQERMFHIIIDEAHNFASHVIPALLQEARKFNVSVILATQHLAGLDQRTRAAVLGSVHTLVCFRLGLEDAELLAPSFDREFQKFNPYMLQHQSRGEAVVRIGERDGVLIDIAAPVEGKGRPEVVKTQSRLHYARRRDEIERKIRRALECNGE